jgi:cell division protein FtsQ
VAVVGLLGWLLLGTSVAGVRTVEVTGARMVDPAQVREVAAIAAGTPLALLDTGAVRARVRTIAAVADADVSRHWPSTVVIALTERTPVATVSVADHYVLLDAAGVVFGPSSARPAGLPVVKVAKPGPDDPNTSAALRVLAALTPQLRAKLSLLVVDSPTRIRLELTDDRTVIWGDAESSDAKAKAATALLNRDGQTIDVSAPDFVTVS